MKLTPHMQRMLLRLLANGPALHPSPWGTVRALEARGLVTTTIWLSPGYVALTDVGRAVAERLNKPRAVADA